MALNGAVARQCLLQPSFIGKGASAIHVISLLTKCDVDFRKHLYANVVPSDGTSMFQGTSQRMMKELTALAPCTMTIMVVAPPG